MGTKKANRNTLKWALINISLLAIPLVLGILISPWFMWLWAIALGIGAGKILKK